MNNTIYEKPKRVERLKDILTLSFFTICIAVISVLIVNLIVYPLTIYAITYTAVFTTIVKYSILLLVLLLVGGYLTGKILRLRNDGLHGNELIKYIILRPLDNLAGFLVTLAVLAVLIFILYQIFSANYDFLYHLKVN